MKGLGKLFGDGDPSEFQTTNDRIEQQQATVFIPEGCGHFMAAHLYFAIESLDDIVDANKLPMFLWELVDSQAGLQIAAQTIGGIWRSMIASLLRRCVVSAMLTQMEFKDGIYLTT